MNKLMMMFLGIFLVSCNSIPYKPLVQFKYKFNKCTVHCFNYNTLKIVNDSRCGEDFEGGDYPVRFCDGVVGPLIQDYARDIKPKAREAIQQCKDAIRSAR